jgi:hypothetical protein
VGVSVDVELGGFAGAGPGERHCASARLTQSGRLMTTATTLSTPRPLTHDAFGEDLEACATCEHTVSHHDAIALRYCKATLVSELTRGCICKPSAS